MVFEGVWVCKIWGHGFMRKRSQASASLLSSAHMQTMTINLDHKVIHFFPDDSNNWLQANVMQKIFFIYMIYRNINFWWLCDLLRILCVNLHLCLCSQFWISSSLSEVLSLNLIFNFREVDNVAGKQLWWVGYWWVNTVLVWGTKKEVCFQYTEMNRHDWWSHSEQRWKKLKSVYH